MKKRILLVVPYPRDKAPNQRFRLEHYLEAQEMESLSYTYASFLDHAAWDILYRPGHRFMKIWSVLKGFLRRFFMLFTLFRYDAVLILREATPLGPPIFEWLMAKVFRKKVIYDFDDAIWMSNTSSNNKWIARLKWHQKVKSICKWSTIVVCGNAYLASYAKQYQANTIIIPTVVDTVNQHNRTQDQEAEKISVGWTGSHSTMQYLDAILPILKKLQERYPFRFYVISNKAPEFELPYLEYIAWSSEQEIEGLMNFHIGLMPLEDTEWAKGKCGFKAIQYMALGMPALVSPVGVNATIVEHGITGYHCNTAEDWEQYLTLLLEDSLLRIQLGKAAQAKIEAEYSVNAYKQAFLDLF
ncbi:MAG: glycosyltransferase [Saprospiraceae bacterium]|nr:glycosyltransferase [Saprospiraceae bacterium]